MFLRPTLFVAGLCAACAGHPATAQPLLHKVNDARIDDEGRRITVVTPLEIAAASSHLVLFSPLRPLGRYDRVADRPQAVFVRPTAPESADQKLRAWLVPSETDADWATRWPVTAPRLAEIDDVGLGQRTIWLAAGAAQGCSVGDTWLLRIYGQPVARAEVRMVGAALSFCQITPLSARLLLERGQRLRFWTSRSAAAPHALESAVAKIEQRDQAQFAWIAAPPLPGFPPDAPVEFRRRGAYVGQGLVERRDALFWYVRLLEGATLGSAQVGDDALLRGPGELLEGRASARVFDEFEGGFLISAGEFDGVSFGQSATAFRGGVPLGGVVVGRVQGGFSVVRLQDPQSSTRLQRLDEIRFAPPPSSPRAAGQIEEVVDEIAFVASVPSGADPADGRIYAVMDGLRTIGAAVLVYCDGTRGLGVLLPSSTIDTARAGMILVEPDAILSQPR